MKLVSKFFDELSTKELYELLKSRAEIFVVEQNCIYQDLDDKDYQSLHVYYETGGKVIAYLRAFWKEEDVIQIGRVLTMERGKGYGRKLLSAGLEEIKHKFQPKKLYLEAQCYAIGYYEREGFQVCSETFLEDGIPHVKMELII